MLAAPYPNILINDINIRHLPLHIVGPRIGCSYRLHNRPRGHPSDCGKCQHGGEEKVGTRGDAYDFVGVGFAAFEKGVRGPAGSYYHDAGSVTVDRIVEDSSSEVVL